MSPGPPHAIIRHWDPHVTLGPPVLWGPPGDTGMDPHVPLGPPCDTGTPPVPSYAIGTPMCHGDTGMDPMCHWDPPPCHWDIHVSPGPPRAIVLHWDPCVTSGPPVLLGPPGDTGTDPHMTLGPPCDTGTPTGHRDPHLTLGPPCDTSPPPHAMGTPLCHRDTLV